VGELAARLWELPERIKGEIVLVVRGVETPPSAKTIDESLLIELLAGVLPPRKASEIAARLTGGRKNDFYKRILTAADRAATDL
jgi:16S rRNA (cytidine1402-2'-O)-methyltransferase